ncbi:MAG TPA: MlaD family protein [Gemmatimonadales bacterium]|nr:MlaD family protein [Gemmatimonadales bacterium]
MDLNYKQEITVGTMVLAGIALFIAGTMWLKGTKIGREHLVRVEFADVGSLKVGGDVTISGVSQGRVKRIELEPNSRVLVTFSVPPNVVPKVDATAKVTAGFFSADARVLFNPGTESAPTLPDGQIIQGVMDEGITGKVAGLGDRADSVMIGLQAIANQRTADDLHTTLVAMQRALNAMESRLKTTGDEAEKTMRSLQALSARLDTTVQTLPLQSAISNADTLTRNLSAMSVQLKNAGSRLDTLLAGINAGQGTLGKFATDSGLYYDMRAVSQSLKNLIDELNKHPGKVTVQVKMF